MESLSLMLIPLSILLFFLILYCVISSKYTKSTKETNSNEIEMRLNQKDLTNCNTVIEKPKLNAFQNKTTEKEKIIDSSKLFNMFCEYVKKNRVINIDQYAKKLHTTKEKVIQQMRDMEKESELMGYLNNNEYFYLTLKEIDLLDNLTRKRNKTYTETEINSLFQEIVSQGK